MNKSRLKVGDLNGPLTKVSIYSNLKKITAKVRRFHSKVVNNLVEKGIYR